MRLYNLRGLPPAHTPLFDVLYTFSSRRIVEHQRKMEDERAQVDLGIAADIEHSQADAAPRQPKKRFVGRKQAAEAALKNGGGPSNSSLEDSGAVQGASLIGSIWSSF